MPFLFDALSPVSHSSSSATCSAVQEEKTRKGKVVVDSKIMSGGGRRVADEEINELVSKLQSLLPAEPRRHRCRRNRGGGGALRTQVPASKVLKGTCSYIKSLQREVDDLSDRLSVLMATMDANSPQAEILRRVG
ncbi:hypothetical protein MUK42_24130 [Musa troglodytarum]|uniref:BHLH domain-containing protein n=1 Tax=Musa troglodytarum TaxID=320322 RepID=A0A9E7EPH7_9LILI|nr:hypothetical protein MUK42_24130 [Musa troglodytarum]